MSKKKRTGKNKSYEDMKKMKIKRGKYSNAFECDYFNGDIYDGQKCRENKSRARCRKYFRCLGEK